MNFVDFQKAHGGPDYPQYNTRTRHYLRDVLYGLNAQLGRPRGKDTGTRDTDKLVGTIVRLKFRLHNRNNRQRKECNKMKNTSTPTKVATHAEGYRFGRPCSVPPMTKIKTGKKLPCPHRDGSKEAYYWYMVRGCRTVKDALAALPHEGRGYIVRAVKAGHVPSDYEPPEK